MKKTFTLPSVLTIVLVLFITNASIAQNTCAWAKKAAGTNEDWGASVASDNFGNVYYLGNFYSNSITVGSTVLQNQPATYFNYGTEMYIAKYDSCGTFKWAKRAGGNSDCRGKSIACDAAGNVFVAGYSFCDTTTFGTLKMYSRAYLDAFVVKYDANGNAVWVVPGYGDYQDRANSLTVSATGDVYVTGNFSSSYIRFGNDSVANYYNNQNFSVFIAKIDNNGATQWVKEGHGSYDNYGYGIATDAAGNAYVTGAFGSNYITFGTDSLALSGYNDIFVVKYSTTGAEQWLRTAGGSGNDQAFSIAADASGNSYITGFVGYLATVSFGTQTITNTTSSYGLFLTKYDANGTALWARKGQGDSYTENHGTNVKLDNNGDPYMIGFYSSDSLQLGALTLINKSISQGAMTGGDTAFDTFIIKYKANGNLSWARTYGGDNHEFGEGIAVGPRGAIYITGEYNSPTLVFPGATLTSLNVNGDAFIANNINMSTEMPDICLVTTDSTSTNNIVFWDKTPYMDVDSFIVYREVSSGIYKRIGAQSYSALSQFTDVNRSVGPANGDPNIGTYRYKLQTLDTAGNRGMMSPYHNTVFFQDNGSGTFTWNLYAVENMTITPVSNFNLMRDNLHNGTWGVIGTVAGTQTTLNDPSYGTYSLTADWRVQALGFSCTPTFKYGNNSAQGAIIKSKSNITNNRGIGVQQMNAVTQLAVYPNPATSILVIAASKELALVTITNALGETVYQIKTKNTEEQIDISKFPTGIYIINALGAHSKLIKE